MRATLVRLLNARDRSRSTLSGIGSFRRSERGETATHLGFDEGRPNTSGPQYDAALVGEQGTTEKGNRRISRTRLPKSIRCWAKDQRVRCRVGAGRRFPPTRPASVDESPLRKPVRRSPPEAV